ncbi:hypothetical protein ABB37_03890 [Leptomonas pyrrhocoris]|uniref:Spermidine synthase n=1 Tax=Leptomonas pyrrhocoris TaxID=157538 RepID=A0A0M9G3S9_LEPPY|nr:hypothetical protein ABB37_03890 [Leptomonas pyrrhocoris]KPA81546.1 hypothetical protein ABB37_03890 [Leptomonas pyrrhocoris]|eukprot:XP_015659985.1 hypothetical protein ABB37_03890 [Leptomonas pyrrhocoris]
MSARTERRKRSSNVLKFHSVRRRKISDAAIVRGVEIEFDRTLPFWRCFTDLRLGSGRKPEVTQRTTRLLCRIPCKVFKRVDVVWARTQVHLHEVNGGRLVRSGGTNTNRAPNRFPMSSSESSHRNGNADTSAYTIDTLHFVHEDAYKKGPGSEHSFHVQSVVLRDSPAVLQCVAGAMVSFSFLVFTSLRLIHACEVRRCHIAQLSRALEPAMQACTHSCQESSVSRVGRKDAMTASPQMTPSLMLRKEAMTHSTEDAAGAFAELRGWCPAASSRILILGMGGNSMALALRAVLGPAAMIEVVEVEPAVVAACLRVGTLDEGDDHMKVHLQDAEGCLRALPHHVYDFIFMDIFEPMEATMQNLHPWVAAAREKLAAGGLLVMNEHQLPSAEGLAPYGKLFGDGNVQAVNLRGWNESVVVCVAPGSPETDTYTLEISKSYTNVAFNVYEALVPGWLPHFSWLVRAKTHYFQKLRCRLWTS